MYKVRKKLALAKGHEVVKWVVGELSAVVPHTSSISLNLGLDPPNMKAAQKATSYALCIRNPPNIRFAVLRCCGMQMRVEDVAWHDTADVK